MKWLASGFIDDEVAENPVEKNLPTREIWAAVAAVGEVCKLEEAFEEFSDDPVGRLHAIPLHEVKPDGVDIEDGVFGKPKRIQIISLDSPDALL